MVREMMWSVSFIIALATSTGTYGLEPLQSASNSSAAALMMGVYAAMLR
jgi:hypothetical protein